MIKVAMTSVYVDDVTKALLTRFRVLTDLTGDFNRVILGYEADSVAEFQARMRD